MCSTRLYNECKNARHFVNAAIKENEISNQSHSPPVVAKKYEDIPGPKGIAGIGTFYQYFPVIGM